MTGTSSDQPSKKVDQNKADAPAQKPVTAKPQAVPKPAAEAQKPDPAAKEPAPAVNSSGPNAQQKPNSLPAPAADAQAKPAAKQKAPGTDVAPPKEARPAKAAGKEVQAVKNTPPAKRPAPKEQPAQVYKMHGAPGGGVPLARPRRRHGWLLASFFALVLLPAAAIVAYLYVLAADRYASNAAFFVHKEESAGAMEMFAGLPALGVAGSATPDANILYQFLQSQSLVEAVDGTVDLRSTHSAHAKTDPVFSLKTDATLEDVVDYWDRIISIVFEADTGLISFEITAFTPEDAQKIGQEILAQSSELINRLSKIARDDTINLAQQELDIAAERLKKTRLDMSRFRDLERIIDPTADIAGQMGVITALQQSLADAMIRRDLLIGTTSLDDPRIQQADRSILAIENRIDEERGKVGAESETESGDVLSRVVGEYEGLLVDRQFAEQSYIAALAAYDAAVAEARRKSRYLAVHIEPTFAETAIYPRRITLGILGTLFLMMFWAILALTAYSIRDRR